LPNRFLPVFENGHENFGRQTGMKFEKCGGSFWGETINFDDQKWLKNGEAGVGIWSHRPKSNHPFLPKPMKNFD
jgi:hypothetical protein